LAHDGDGTILHRLYGIAVGIGSFANVAKKQVTLLHTAAIGT
jgi:hypothetical protein